MQKLSFFILAMIFILPACTDTDSRKSPHESIESENVKVTYGRPYKKGREIFGGLEKYGKVWRTGADEATEITFYKNVEVAGKPVKAGTYTLYTIPGEKEWTIILNGQTGQSGTEYNKNRDVIRVNVPATRLDKVIEQLTIRFTKTSMFIEWDRIQVEIPIIVDTSTI